MDVETTPAPTCTCPSGDGSLRSLCPVHAAVAAINLHEERIGFVLMPLSPAAVAPHVVEFIMGFDFDEVRDVYGERFAIFWQGLVGKFTAVAPALYITTDLAADFACTRAQHLAARQPGAQVPGAGPYLDEPDAPGNPLWKRLRSIANWLTVLAPNCYIEAAELLLSASDRIKRSEAAPPAQADHPYQRITGLQGIGSAADYLARHPGDAYAQRHLSERIADFCKIYGVAPAQGVDLGQQQDAARCRWVREQGGVTVSVEEADDDGDLAFVSGHTPEELDAAIDGQRDAGTGVGA